MSLSLPHDVSVKRLQLLVERFVASRSKYHIIVCVVGDVLAKVLNVPQLHRRRRVLQAAKHRSILRCFALHHVWVRCANRCQVLNEIGHEVVRLLHVPAAVLDASVQAPRT